MNTEDKLNAIDFPCSYSWRAYYEETFYGRYLPTIDMPIKEPEPIVQTRIVMNLDAKAMELQNRIVALENKLHSDKKKRFNKYD